MLESVSLFAALLAGLLSFLSPCVLPLVPAYLGFISGASWEELEATTSRRRILVPAIWFVAGFSLVFMLMGASATLLGQLLIQHRATIARVGGVLVVIMGLHLLGVFRISPLLREKRLQLTSTPGGFAGAALAGAVFGAAWSPCLGPVLSAVLTAAAVQETMLQAELLLAAYSAGLAIPFLLAASATGWFIRQSKRLRHGGRIVEAVSGAVLVIVGLLLVTGSFTSLSALFARYTPEFLLEYL